MRHKRKTDHHWKVVVYKPDICWYATCKCGFAYGVSRNVRNEDGSWSFEQYIDPQDVYQYCPRCGARKKTYDESPAEIIDSF